MACRAEDISNYRDDIENLEQALFCAERLIDSSLEVGTALTNLQKQYKYTIGESGDFTAQFHKLDENSENSARTIKARINEALETVREQLRQAELEEASCEIHHL